MASTPAVATSLIEPPSTASPAPVATSIPAERRSGAAIIAEAAYLLVAQADVRPDVRQLLGTG